MGSVAKNPQLSKKYLSTGSSSDSEARNESFPSTLAGVLKRSGIGAADFDADDNDVDGVAVTLLDDAGLRQGEVEMGILDFVKELVGVLW